MSPFKLSINFVCVVIKIRLQLEPRSQGGGAGGSGECCEQDHQVSGFESFFILLVYSHCHCTEDHLRPNADTAIALICAPKLACQFHFTLDTQGRCGGAQRGGAAQAGRGYLWAAGGVRRGVPGPGARDFRGGAAGGLACAVQCSVEFNRTVRTVHVMGE